MVSLALEHYAGPPHAEISFPGVYKSGFATTQEAYEKAITTLFGSLDRAEADLSKSGGPYFHGDRLTETDIRLYPVRSSFASGPVQC